MSSTDDESNALGLSVNSTSNMSLNDVSASPVNDSSSSLGRTTSIFKSQPRTPTAKPPATKTTIRQRLSSFARRDKSRQSTVSMPSQPRSPVDGKPNHPHSNSDPVIETIRASPEELRGPSAASDPVPGDDTRVGRPLDRNLLTSTASSPRPEHPKLPDLRRRSARSSTSPIPSHVNVDLPHTRKRLVVCCDGCVIHIGL